MIGKMLSHYTAGKLPKAFKIIPSLSNWEEVSAYIFACDVVYACMHSIIIIIMMFAALCVTALYV
jgi:Bystin